MRRNHAIRSHLSAIYTLQSASLLYYTSAHTQTPTHPNILLAWSPNDKSNTVENFKRTHTHIILKCPIIKLSVVIQVKSLKMLAN